MLIKKNTHAEVPIVILVLGVLFLCVLTFVNFTLFSNKEDKYGGLENIADVEQCLVYIEQYRFYENMGYSPTEIENLPIFKGVIDSQKNLICKPKGLKITFPLSK
ncbi:MAG: hypothetical protein ABIH28_02860 [archaeon]